MMRTGPRALRFHASALRDHAASSQHRRMCELRSVRTQEVSPGLRQLAREQAHTAISWLFLKIFTLLCLEVWIAAAQLDDQTWIYEPDSVIHVVPAILGVTKEHAVASAAPVHVAAVEGKP